MSHRHSFTLGEGGYSRNSIPSGRQLSRTPPISPVKRQLEFCGEDPVNTEAGTRVHNQLFDVNTPERKPGTSPSGLKLCSAGMSEDDPSSMLRGMEGYKPTPADMEFIKKMKQGKLIKKLQEDLTEVQRLLKIEAMALDLSLASREKAQADLTKFPSREELTEAAKVALEVTTPSADITGLDSKSLLALVKKEDVRRAIAGKKMALAQMKTMLEKRRREAIKEREQREKQILNERGKIREMMSHLSNLKSELVQVEENCKALEMQVDGKEAAEIKSQKSQNLRARDSKTDHRKENANEALKTKRKPEDTRGKLTKSMRASKPSQDKVKGQELDSQGSVRAVRGRRKQSESSKTATPQPKNQSNASAKEALASERSAPAQCRKKATEAVEKHEEEAQNVCLRRSKRIASRK